MQGIPTVAACTGIGIGIGAAVGGTSAVAEATIGGVGGETAAVCVA